MNRFSFARAALAISAICFVTTAMKAAEDLPSAAKVLDPAIIFYSWPYPTISPDGRWVAYISRGFVCVCNVNDPAPRRLFEVPDSWTHFIARPEYACADGDVNTIFRHLSRDDRQKLQAQITSTVFGLQWTHQSDGVAFGLQSYDTEQKKVLYDLQYVSLQGAAKKLGHIEQGFSHSGSGSDFYLSRDHKFVVLPGHFRPLIWSLATNKPCATPFLNLTPSPTSDRWIGIEKDTRQLVIVDETFEVVKRFEEHRPTYSYGFQLNWSPDERYIIWRNQVGFDHFSNWEGFWMDLDTGKKRELWGRAMNELFAFTGRGGEFLRFGATFVPTRGYDQASGARFMIFPEGSEPPEVLWQITNDPVKPKFHGLMMHANSPLLADPQCELFAMLLPKPSSERAGCVWQLIDREKKMWRLPGEETDEFFSPYNVVGFADGGKTIIAHDAKRLFSIPVVAIQDPENRVE